MPGIDLLPDLNGSKYYHPKKWTQRHRQCVALHMAGWTNNEIAEALDWTAAKVSITVNDPRAEYEKNNALSPIADVALTVSEKLEEASHEAFAKAFELLNAEKEDTALKAAFGILDRAGFTPIKREVKLEGEVPVNPEMIEAMKRTLQESTSIKATYKIRPEPEEEEEEPHLVVEDAEYEIVQGQVESYVEMSDGEHE